MLTSCGHRWKDSSMVDYAMDIGEAGSEYERPVQAPTLTSAGIAAGFLKGVGDMIDTYESDVKAGRPTEASIKREGYASFIKELDSIKGKSPLDQQVALRGILNRVEEQGFEVGEAHIDAIKRRTGIDASNYMTAVDPNVATATAALNELGQNPEYSLLARKALIQEGVTNPTDMQILERATNIIATNKAAVLHVTASANISKSEFEDTKGLWETTIKSLTQTGLAGLSILEAEGNLSPETILGFKNRLTAIKAVMTKPASVTDDQWQGIASKIEGLETLINTLATYDQTKIEAMSTDALGVVAERLLKQGDPLLARALVDEAVMSTYVATNQTTLQKALNSVKTEDIEYTDISFAEYDDLAEAFTGIPDMTEASEIKAALAVEKAHNEEMLEKAKAYDNETRLNVIETLSGVDVAGMSIDGITQNQEVRQVFANGIGGAALAVSTANELFEISTLSKLFNMDTYRKLEAFVQQNPQVGNGLKMKMRDALHKQRVILGKSAEAMLGQLETEIFIDERGKVRFDKFTFWPDTILRNFSAEEESEIKAFHITYYNGDFEAMIKDGGRKIKEGDPRLFQLIKERSGVGNRIFEVAQRDYNTTIKYHNTMAFLEKQLRALNAGQAELDAMIYRPMRLTRQQREDSAVAAATAPQPTEADLLSEEVVDVVTGTDGPMADLGTKDNPYVIEEGSELKQKRQYDLLPTGSYFIDINDSVDEETGKRVVYIK